LKSGIVFNTCGIRVVNPNFFYQW